MDDVLALFGGRTKPVMAHLVESGKLTLRRSEGSRRSNPKLAKPKPSRKEGRG